MQVEAFGKPTSFRDVPDGAFFLDLRTGGPAVCGVAVSRSGYRGAIFFEDNGPLYVGESYAAVHVIEGAVLRCDPLSAVYASMARQGAVIRNGDDAYMAAADIVGKVSWYSLTTGQYVSHVDTSEVFAFTKWEIVVPQDGDKPLSIVKIDRSRK